MWLDSVIIYERHNTRKSLVVDPLQSRHNKKAPTPDDLEVRALEKSTREKNYDL